MLGQKKKYWLDKDSLQTVTDLCNQPACWKKTQKAVREQKDAIKAFVEPVLTSRNKTVVFCGLDGILAETLFAWVNTDVEYNCRWIGPEEVLDPETSDLLVCVEHDDNGMALAEIIDRQPEPVRILIVTSDENSLLVRAGADQENILAIQVPAKGITSLMLASFMTLHLDILDDLQLDDVIHAAQKVLQADAAALETFIRDTSFASIRAVGFNIRQKRHALKEMAGVMKVSFVSPYTGIPYEGKVLNLLYLPDNENMRKEQLGLLKVLRRENQLTFAVESRHDDNFLTDGSLDLKLLMARNNVYAAFGFLVVFEVMTVLKAVQHNIALDQNPGEIKLTLDSWMEKQKFGDSIIIDL